MTEMTTPPPPPAADDPPPPPATVHPSLPLAAIRRPETMRWTLLIGLFGLAAICGAIAYASIGESFATVVMMAGAGLALLVLGRALFFTEATKVVFDGARLIDDSGHVLCTLEDIDRVERGFALFKPSSGFVLTLKVPGARGWSPGLWWRYGRRIGVGGATPGRAGRYMADAITAAMAMKTAG